MTKARPSVYCPLTIVTLTLSLFSLTPTVGKCHLNLFLVFSLATYTTLHHNISLFSKAGSAGYSFIIFDSICQSLCHYDSKQSLTVTQLKYLPSHCTDFSFPGQSMRNRTLKCVHRIILNVVFILMSHSLK